MYRDETPMFSLVVFVLVLLFCLVVWSFFVLLFSLFSLLEYAEFQTLAKDDLCTPHTWRLHSCKKKYYYHNYNYNYNYYYHHYNNNNNYCYYYCYFYH